MTYVPPPMNYASPDEQPRPASGLAIAAMVCGILGLLFVPLGLVGLILGIIALAKRRNPRDGGKGMAITGVVTGGLSMLCLPVLLISILLPGLNRAREAANRIKCSSNMRQIGLAIKMYANGQPNMELPPNLAIVAATQQITPDVFVCPTSNQVPASGPVNSWAKNIVPGGPNCSYVYVWQPGYTDNMPADAIWLYEPPTDHGGDGMNVLYADGHVDWVAKNDAAHVIAELQAGHNPPKP